MTGRPVRLASLVFVSTVVCSLFVAIPAAHAISLNAPCAEGADFNHDGFQDVAIAAPDATVAGHGHAGTVTVMYGRANGLRPTGSQVWSQNTVNVEGTSQANDRFGAAIANGDFNFDQFTDLAIGVPGDNGGIGAVNILYGSASGLRATSPADQIFIQGTGNMGDAAEAGDRFGSSLSVGRFNNDTYPDLAVGIPNEDIPSFTDTGAIAVIYSGSSGLQATSPDDQLMLQSDLGGFDGSSDRFGYSMAACDLDGDNYSELAIGDPFEEGGFIYVAYGASGGLNVSPPHPAGYYYEDLYLGTDGSEFGDHFGLTITAGHFHDDTETYGDLAIGIPDEDVGTKTNAGAVLVVYANASGLTSANYYITQDASGILDSSEAGDRFGAALEAGDFTEEYSDLAVGVPGENVGTISNAGAVAIFYGHGILGIDNKGNQFFTQNSAGVADTAQGGDMFGYAVAAGDVNGDGFQDLTVGVPFENVGSVSNGGAINEFYGAAGLASGTRTSPYFDQNTTGVAGTAQANGHWGLALNP